MIRDDIHLNALMMEGWTSQTFRMAAGESQGFEDVPQEWSSSHTLSTFQKACLRTAFQSLRRNKFFGVTNSGSECEYNCGFLAEAFPPKLENAILQAMKQKLVHLKLPIGTDSCGPFSFYSVGEFGP